MTYKILTFVPGAEESREKFGYVGQAGQLLTSYFAQLWPEDLPPVMLGNAVLCRPKDNATPTISQYKKCGKNFWPYLLTDHNLIADNCLILATGSIAYKMLYAIADGTPSASAIMSAHGKPVQLSFRNPDNPDDLRTFWIVPMIHPAYVLRGQTPERYTLLKEDFIVAYNAYYDIQETGTVNMAALLNQSSDNAIDLDKDLQGDVYDHPLTDKEADLIMEMIESDYKNMTGEDDKKIVSYDVETTALETQYESTVITLAGIGTLNKSTFQFEGEAIPSIGKIFKRLKEKGYYLVGHNIWYDLIMSWKTGIFSCVDDLPEIRDTRVMHKLLDENSADNKLKWLCQKYFGIADWSQELNSMMDSEGKVQWSKLDDEKRQSLRKYHKGDLYWTTKLCYLLMDKLKESGASDYWKIDYVDFKCRLHKELIQTSINGFMIDPKALEAQRTEYQTKQDAVVEWFHQPLYYRVVASLKVLDKPLKEAVQSTLCNFALGDIYNPEKDAFNPNSTQHVAALLATVLSSDDSFRQQVIRSLGRKGKTPKGRLSLNEDSIEKICETLVSAKTLTGHSMAHKYDHLVEGLKKVLEFRGLKKILSTYLEGMAKFIWPDGSVRAQWNVDGAATGRLSCVAEGSLVACVDGDKPIESVKVGDMVYCYDEDDNLVTRPVLAVLDQGYKECMEFFWRKKQSNDSDFEQGSLICTPDHLLKQCVPQLNNRTGWLQAKDCMEPLFGINLGRKGYWYQIVSRWHVGIKHVYDLTVDECHNFIANELVSHNCSRPNLQNLPRGDTATAIKKMFVPRYEGYCFMQFDLSQAELRGLGSFSHDPNLKHAYDEGLDLHTYTAANMWHHGNIEKVSKHERSIAKTINFATVYGANAPTIANTAGISVEEAESAMQKWLEFYSCVQPYMDKQSELVETQEFVTGLWGLKRNLPMYMANEKDGADLKRQAGNSAIQNFASDFNCFLMLIVMDYVKQYNLRNEIRMVNTVHDSIVFEVKGGYESTLASFYLSAMNQMNEYCAELIGKEYYVKMRGDCEVGLTYGDLYEAEIDPETFEVSIIDKS